MTVSPETLAAYVDGELDEAEAARVEAALEQDPTLAEALARQMMLSTRLSAAYDPVLTEPLPERLVAAAQAPGLQLLQGGAQEPAGHGGPRSAFTMQGRTMSPAWRGLSAMAACLVIGLAAGLFLPQRQPVVLASDMTAKGALAAALDNNLAADPQQAIHIGLTFRRTGGGVCRTFDMGGKGLAGVACRAGQGWKVQVATPSQTATSSDYRTASSMPGPVASTVESMIEGQPFDAAAEKAAKDRGWK